MDFFFPNARKLSVHPKTFITEYALKRDLLIPTVEANAIQKQTKRKDKVTKKKKIKRNKKPLARSSSCAFYT